MMIYCTEGWFQARTCYVAEGREEGSDNGEQHTRSRRQPCQQQTCLSEPGTLGRHIETNSPMMVRMSQSGKTRAAVPTHMKSVPATER